jgi:hypothetical protein
MLLTPSQAAAGGRRYLIGSVALVAAVGLAAACDGGSGGQFGGQPDGGTGGQNGGLRFDGGGLKGGVIDVDAMAPRDPPAVNKEAIKLPFPKRARLIGNHTSACSNQTPEGATLQSQVGDR